MKALLIVFGFLALTVAGQDVAPWNSEEVFFGTKPIMLVTSAALRITGTAVGGGQVTITVWIRNGVAGGKEVPIVIELLQAIPEQ